MSLGEREVSASPDDGAADRYAGLHPVLARPPLGEYVRELWQRRVFILTLPRNNLRAQNLDTMLGNVWYLMNPALQTLIYFFVFGVLFNGNRGVDNYLGYLVIGVLTFNLIGQASTTASRCVVNNRALIRSLYFPRAAVPLTSAVFSIAVYLPGAVVMLAVAWMAGSPPTWRWTLLPFVLALTVALVTGIVLIVARIGRAIPDLYLLLPHIVRLLFYVSGVLFDPRTLTANTMVLRAFNLNPFFQILSLWRWVLLGREVPFWMWPNMTILATVTLVGGFVYFWRAETSYGSER